MSDQVIYRFQPDAMDERVLRKLFVGRKDLFNTIKNEIEKAVDNRTPRYYLIVGPRGIGKSHFTTLLYYDVKKLKNVLCVKLSEDEFSIYRVSDLFLRIFEEIEGKKFNAPFKMGNSELVDAIMEYLREKNKIIAIFIENLYLIFKEQMDEKEIKQLKSIFQEKDIFMIIATSPLIFTDISQGSKPFYNFFNIKHLKELNGEEIKEMIEIIDELEGKLGNIESYHGKIDSIVNLTGGNPRIVILLYDLMCKGDILDVEKVFFKILDEYTPYYQDIFRNLAAQQRKIFDTLISLGKPATPKEIAETARLRNDVVVTQLRRLEKDGYVVSHRIGRYTKYEVKERLFRLWREQRQPLGRKRISILLEFLRLWYTPEEREKEFSSIMSHLEVNSRLVKEVEYLFHALTDESKMKFIPKIAEEFCESGMLESLEEFFEIGDETLKKAFTSEKLKILLKNKKYDYLIKETKKIIKEDEKNETAWFIRGSVLRKLKKYDEALEAFDKALEINPDDADKWYGKGIALLDLQKYDEALEAFDKALEINPEGADAWYGRGFALWNLQKYEEALEAFNKSLDINPEGADAWYGKGITLLNLQKYDEALEAFDKALEINPRYDYAWYNRGITLLDLQKYDEALEAFDKALEINPEYLDALAGKGLALLRLQKYDEALRVFDEVFEINPEDVNEWYSWYIRGFILESLQKYDEALRVFDKALEINPRYIYALTGRGFTLWSLQKYDEALEAFDKALEINLECSNAWEGRGFILESLQKYDEALKSFDKALEINPDDADKWYGRGLTLLDLQKYDEALKSFDKALEINPEYGNSWKGRGLTLLDLQKYDEALKSFDKALEINPDDVDALYGRGLALGSLGKYEETYQTADIALQIIDKLLEINPDDAHILLRKGAAHLQIATREFKKNNLGNAIDNVNFAMDSFLKIWYTREKEIKETITAFFKDLIDLRQIKAVDISLKEILKKKEELTLFLNPISMAVEIVTTKNARKYYDLQVEERDIVVDIVRRLTGSQELLPEDYKR